MTNLDGLAVLLFVINSAKGNGLGTQLLQVKRVVSHVACCSNVAVTIQSRRARPVPAGPSGVRALRAHPLPGIAPETRYEDVPSGMRVTPVLRGALTLNPADAALRFLAHSAQLSPLFQICKARLLLCDGRLSRTRLQ
jgi:hypothetical protein